MTLSGNLGFVPIDEVLRLLTRSHQQGSIDVTGDGVRGRVFFGESGIELATSFDDRDLHRHLLNSNYVEEDTLDRIVSEGTALAAVADRPAIVDLLRELSVEGLYQMASRGEEFEVREGATTPYASPAVFDLDRLLEDVNQRDTDWREVAASIPDLGETIEFRRDLGDREDIKVNVDEWKVLSEIGAGSSVQEIADRLGTTEFWAARVAVRLLGADLIRLGGTDPEIVDSSTGEGTNEVEIQPEPSEPQVPLDPVVEETANTHANALDASALRIPDEDDDDDVDPDESWWQEPRVEESVEEDPESRTPAVVSEGLSEIPAVEAADNDDDDDDVDDVEEDTEAFLEKVFSELDSTEEDTEGGHGLLRRRRMGTLRDFSSDS